MSSLRLGLHSGISKNLQKTSFSAKSHAKNGGVSKGSITPTIQSSEPIAAVSPLVKEHKSSQSTDTIESEAQTVIQISPLPSTADIDVSELYEDEQSADYYRQVHDSLETSLHEAMDRNLAACNKLASAQKKVREALDRLSDLHSVLSDAEMSYHEPEDLDEPVVRIQ